MENENNKNDNYQKLFEIFKDVHDIGDILQDLNRLDYLYTNQSYHEMKKHILKISQKHKIEAKIWNRINTKKSSVMCDIYLSARHFLCVIGCKELINCGIDIKDYLTTKEVDFIESKVKLMT